MTGGTKTMSKHNVSIQIFTPEEAKLILANENFPGALPEGDPIPAWALCVLSAAWACASTVIACVWWLT